MTSTFDEIEIRDRLQIEDRIARYSWAFDSGDMPAYLDCFTPDGVIRHPLRDGSPGRFVGHEGIESFFGNGFRERRNQSYGHQHQFSTIRQTREGEDIHVDAYCTVFRHEFHRQYWPRSASWRMGTWHALLRRSGDEWRIADLDIRMWTDTALGAGEALVDRGPGMPGIRD